MGSRDLENFDFLGMVFRIKYNHDNGKFIIRKKADVESIARERGAEVILRPRYKTKRKSMIGRYFLMRSRQE